MNLNFTINDHQTQIRIKEIQNCTQHVQNIIQSVHKMIQTQTIKQKQKLQIKISIENEHLNKVFSRVNKQRQQLKVSIKQSYQPQYNIKINNYYPYEVNDKQPLILNQQTKVSVSKQIFKNDTKINPYIEIQTSKYSQKQFTRNIDRKSNAKVPTINSFEQFNTPSKNVSTGYDISPDYKISPEYKISPKHNISHIYDRQHGHMTSSQTRNKGNKQTNYKQILKQNKQKLFLSQSRRYKIHLDLLQKKQQQRKSRLQYPLSNKMSSSRVSNQRSSSRLSSQISTSRLSHKRSNQRLHCKTLSKISNCRKCTKKQQFLYNGSKKTLESYHLARKYLTKQGEDECYNFLKAQGIPERQWPTYVTQYVYRQLSKLSHQHLLAL